MADDDVYIRLQGRYAMLAQGVISVEDLDDEELARGQLRAADGSWRGKPPKLVPAALIQAMRREWMGRAEAKLREALLTHGLGVLVELASDPTIDASVRLRASQTIIERTMGKVPERITVAAEDPVETLFRSILADPAGLAPVELSAEERALLG